MPNETKKTSGWQLGLGLAIGFIFGFLLQKGGATRYEIIMGQLLLTDWTVAKIILTAVATGAVGIYAMRAAGWVRLHKKSGSMGATVIGGLIFGIGFGLLGYCPGTAMGASGQGSLDALLGGVMGMVLGTAFYAAIYRRIRDRVLNKGRFGDATLPELLKINGFAAALICALITAGFLFLLEWKGL